MTRILGADAFGQPLDEDLPAGTEVMTGEPTAGFTELGHVSGADVGIWEMTPGVARDVEAEEIFVVLSGRATVSFVDGESIELRPGSVVSLTDGEQTIWSVHETLRKIYVTPRA
jgi:uncharacterized protein